MRKLAGILAGCGFLDGAEIQEVVVTLLAFERRGVQIEWFAPDQPQAHVVSHLKAEPQEGTRNVLEESARIVRGAVRPLQDLDPASFDGLLLPGGFGAAKNLCSFAFKGKDMVVLPALEELVLKTHELKKPMGFICIAPVIAARVLGAKGHSPLLSIGNHAETAEAIQSWGARHQLTKPEEFCHDASNRIFSTAAWNAASSVVQVEIGINRLAEAMIDAY